MIVLTEGNNYDFNYLLDKYEYPDYSKYKNDKNVFYHNTYWTNVDEISKHGLRCDKAKAEYDAKGIIPMIWAVDVPGGEVYGGCTIAFRYDLTNENGDKVNDHEYNLFEDVPPEDILFIDTWISESNGMKRLSDVPRLINKMGEDRVRKTLIRGKERGLQLFYDPDYLIEHAKR